MCVAGWGGGGGGGGGAGLNPVPSGLGVTCSCSGDGLCQELGQLLLYNRPINTLPGLSTHTH